MIPVAKEQKVFAIRYLSRRSREKRTGFMVCGEHYNAVLSTKEQAIETSNMYTVKMFEALV